MASLVCLSFSLLALLCASPDLPRPGADEELRVYVSVDMEGICGVVDSDQVSSSGKDYDRARLWMTEEVNYAVQGAFDAGATSVVVNDSHGTMRNVLIEKLHPEAELISGAPKQLSMMEGIDASFGAVVFIGYHGRMGTRRGILDHTMSSSRVANVRMNGVLMNEASLNAAIAGHFGVPVVFIAGDQAVVDQTRAMLGETLEAVAVKVAHGRHAARNLSLPKARSLIRAGVTRAVRNRAAATIYKIDSPVRLELEVQRSSMVDSMELVPGVERTDGRTVVYTGDDYLVVFKLMRALLILAGS